MIDIVDELEAEASYRFSDLFGRAADEIKMLRKAKQDAFDLGFVAAGGSIYSIDPEISPARLGSLPLGESDPSVTIDPCGADTPLTSDRRDPQIVREGKAKWPY